MNKYRVELMPQAIKDLKKLPKLEAKKVVSKINGLEARTPESRLTDDIKRLRNFSHGYRLRVGNYRVLFEIEGQTIIIYRVKHRQGSYATH